MKRAKIANFLLWWLAVFLGCFTLPAIAQTKPRLSVLQCDVSLDGQPRNDLARFLTDKLSGKIDSLEVVTVVDYQSLPEVMKFLEDMQKTRSPEQYASQLGKMIGADQILIPRVMGFGNSYQMTAKLIDVATGRSLKVYEAEASGGAQQIPKLVDALTERLRADSDFGSMHGVEELPLPDQASQRLAMAETYLKNGESSSALEQVEAARTAWANDLRVLERCAVLYDKLGQYQQAISVLDQWVKEAQGGKSPGQAKMDRIQALKAEITAKLSQVLREQQRQAEISNARRQAEEAARSKAEAKQREEVRQLVGKWKMSKGGAWTKVTGELVITSDSNLNLKAEGRFSAEMDSPKLNNGKTTFTADITGIGERTPRNSLPDWWAKNRYNDTYYVFMGRFEALGYLPAGPDDPGPIQARRAWIEVPYNQRDDGSTRATLYLFDDYQSYHHPIASIEKE